MNDDREDVMSNSRSNPCLKTISIVVMLLFLWDQVVWAGDLPYEPSGEVFHYGEGADGQFMDPADVSDRQSAQESLIARQQYIEDFSANEVSVTTGEGDTIFYSSGEITRIEKEDGTVIRDIVLDAEGQLSDADIEYADGTLLTFRGGKKNKAVLADGTVYTYNPDGLIGSIMYPDGNSAVYSYVIDGAGDITCTVLSDPEKNVYYDNGNKLEKVEYHSGKLMEYDNGMLSKITETDGTVYIYGKAAGDGGYTVSLEKIRYKGNIYNIDGNNIMSIELSDGTVIREFRLDDNGLISSGDIERTDGLKYSIRDGFLAGAEYSDGTKVRYSYTLNDAGEITICDISVEDGADIREYEYSKDAVTGYVTIREGTSEYVYDSGWNLLRFNNGSGTYELLYDAEGRRTGITSTGDDGTVREYGDGGILEKAVDLDGRVYEYFTGSGLEGKVKTVVCPDGEMLNFDHELEMDGTHKVSASRSYDAYNTTQGYYGKEYIEHTLAPRLKTSFTIDGDKSWTSFYAGASYYKPGERSVSMYINIYGSTPRLYYYSYKYGTYETDRKNEALPVTINKDTKYTVEYVWAAEGVEIYLYDASLERPDEPVFTLEDGQWDPKFYISGNNADITLDPLSSGEYSRSTSAYTDYEKSVEGDFVYSAEFSLDDDPSAAFSCSLYGSAGGTHESVCFDHRNGTSQLRLYGYGAGGNVNETVPVDVELDSGVTYVLRAVTREGTLNIYVYRKGEAHGDPVYTRQDFPEEPQIYASVCSGDMEVEASDAMSVYTYDGTGALLNCVKTAGDESITYAYDVDGSVSTREVVSEDGTRRTYGSGGRLLREEKSGGETVIYEYDEDGNIVAVMPEFPSGTVLEYYGTGPFVGKLKKAALPDGDVLYYRYRITDDGNLAVHKRSLYDNNNVSGGYSGKAYVDSKLDPSLKASFNLDPDKAYSYMSAGASYYRYGERSVNMSFSVYGEKARVYYFTYDYKTRERLYRNEELDVTVNRGTDYTLEYVWENGFVNVYLYESSGRRPATPAYSINDSAWSPRFRVGGTNADIDLDPSSSGEYTEYGSSYTDYNSPMGENPICRTEFTFDESASRRSMYYGVSGGSDGVYDSVYLNCYNGAPRLWVSHYDSARPELNERREVPVDLDLAAGTTYVILTEVEDGTVKMYVHEKDGTAGDPLYVVENVDWTPAVYLNVYGGSMSTEAYDGLEIYEYNTQEGVLFDSIDAGMEDSGTWIVAREAVLPPDMFDCGAPEAFPDGTADIFGTQASGLTISPDLPGDMYAADGQLDPGYDLGGLAYFNRLTYGPDGTIREILSPAGEVLTCEDGMPVSLLTDLGTTRLDFVNDEFDRLSSIIAERDGVTRSYNTDGTLASVTDADGIVVNFDAEGDILSLVDTDGVKYLYEEKRLSLIADTEGVEYSIDEEDRITHARYPDGREYGYAYETDPEGRQVVIVSDLMTGDRRYYRDDLLYYQDGDLGLESFYEYDADGRLSRFLQKKGEKEVNVFVYGYEGGVTTIEDIDGALRIYDADERISEYHDTRGHVYRFYHDASGGMISELVELHKNDGRVVYYSEGGIDHVDCPNGVVIRDVEFDDGKLRRFTLVLTNGQLRACTVYGEWVEIMAPDGTKLVYRENALVAINAGGKLFRFRDDEIPSDIELDISDGAAPIEFDLMSSGFRWRDPEIGSWPNYYLPAGDPLIYHAAIRGTYQREVYVDLEYRTPYGGRHTSSYDLDGEKISFYVKLEEGTLQDGNKLIVEAFAKDSGWRTEYSTEVTITEAGQWYKVDMVISDETPLFGQKSPGFDPERIKLIGIRLRNPYGNYATYDGDVYVMDANHSTLAEWEYVKAPFLVNEDSIRPYVGLLFEESDPDGNPNYLMWNTVPSRQKDATIRNSDVILDAGNWRFQDIEYTRGITGISRNDAENCWEIDAELLSDSETNSDGEVFIDLRYDLPDYDYRGPLNLAGKTLTFRVKAPAGFIADTDHQSWAQVYVKDEEYDYQYGPYVNITRADEWYTVTLTPRHGDIPGGDTADGFDPSRVINIGVKFSCAEGSNVDFDGTLYLRNATPSSVFNSDPPEMLIDLSTLSEYANKSGHILGFEEELGPEVLLAREHLPNYFKDDTWDMKTEYDSLGRVVCALKGNTRVEHFDENGRLYEITDPEWGSVVTYSYDSAGNIVDIDYSGTRTRTAEAIRDARVEIETRTAQAVYELGEAKLGAIQHVEDTIGSQIRASDRALQELYASLNQINSWDPFWSWDKKKKNSIRNDIERSIAQVRDTKQQLVQAAAEAYEQIDEDIAYARGEIDQEYEASMGIVREREENAEREILEQEVEQLLYIYYMKIMGRNPGREEIAVWLLRAEEQGCLDPEDRVMFDVSTLRAELLSSDEYGQWKGFNSGVRQAVGDFLRVYTAADTTGEEKLSMLQTLGITADEIDGLNGASWGEEDVEVILDWMSDTEINFGRCAFETVREFLDRKGIQVDLKLTAIDLILTDIFAGAIDCFTDGPLEISLYAMSTYINRHMEGSGETAYNARIDIGDLRGVVEGGGKVIAHLANDHYVLVTAIDADGSITYFETNNGAAGESVMIDEITFRMHWTGYVLSDRGPPAGKTISDSEALSVRGNLDPFSAFVLWMAIISTALSFIDNEICQTISKILGVATLVFSAIAIVATLPNILTNFYTGISNASSAASSSMSEAIGIISGGIEGLVTNLSNVAQLSVNFISAISYNVAITQGLSFLNINSDLARITASFMTGGFLMPDNFLAGALTASARTGISIFGRETGLDPFITDLLATSACALGTAFMTGIDITVPGPDGAPEIQHLAGLEALSHSWNTTVMPRFSEEIAYIGIQKLGELTGLDPRISYLAGIGIRSSLQAGLGTFGQGGGSPGDWIDTTIDELTNPTNLALAFNIIGDELGLPPMINNMIITAIVGTIDAFNENPENRITGMFEGMFQNFWDASIRALTFGAYDPVEGGWNQDMQKDYVLMNLTRFVEVVMEHGIEAAIENHLTNIFRDEAIRIINERGGIADFLTGEAEMVQEGDYWLKQINISDEDKLYLDPETNDIIGRDYGDIKERGEYGINPYTGGFGLIKGTLVQAIGDGTRMVYHVSNSTIIERMEVYGESGGYIQIISTDPETGLELNDNGIPLGGVVADFEGGKIYQYEFLGDSIDFELNFDNPQVDIQDVLDIDLSNLTNEQKEELLNYYLVLNGIGNQNPYGSPMYMFTFQEDLANADPLPTDIALIPLYKDGIPTVHEADLGRLVDDFQSLYSYLGAESYIDSNGKLTQKFYGLSSSSELTNLPVMFESERDAIYEYLIGLNLGLFDDAGDVAKNVIEWCLKTEEIANEIMANLQAEYGYTLPDDMTSLCYSGSGDPFIHLANSNPDMDVNSLVLVGTPIKRNREITNENIETVVTIFGSDDGVFSNSNELLRAGDDTFDGFHFFENNPRPINEIAIELIGVDHLHYFYDPTNPEGDIELKQKASRFIAEIAHRADDEELLWEYLTSTNGIDFDMLNNVFVVDLERMDI